MNNFDAIIFDVDGVLIDVRLSFREAIKKTVSYVALKKYYKQVTVEDEDIQTLKTTGDFNNDFDLSFALIKLLLKSIPRNEFSKRAERFKRQDRETQSYQETQSIFETFYWGNKLFLKYRGIQPPFPCSLGLIENETLLIKKSILKKLKEKYKLGVATGRTQYEMAFPIKKWQLIPKYFEQKYIITEDDVYEIKPNPAPLLEAKKRMNSKNPVYVGDTVSDVLAAKNANILCIYIGNEKLGDYRINNVNDLPLILR